MRARRNALCIVPTGSRTGCTTCERVTPRTTTALRSVPVNDQLDRPVSGFHDHDLVARYEEPVVTQDWYPVQYYDWEYVKLCVPGNRGTQSQAKPHPRIREIGRDALADQCDLPLGQ